MSGEATPARGWNALAIHPGDNVAVAIADIASGAVVRVWRDGTVSELIATEPIALGHKVALVDLAPGAAITKYGETIGVATAPIATGHHVHVHNLVSQRGRRT